MFIVRILDMHLVLKVFLISHGNIEITLLFGSWGFLDGCINADRHEKSPYRSKPKVTIFSSLECWHDSHKEHVVLKRKLIDFSHAKVMI